MPLIYPSILIYSDMLDFKGGFSLNIYKDQFIVCFSLSKLENIPLGLMQLSPWCPEAPLFTPALEMDVLHYNRFEI